MHSLLFFLNQECEGLPKAGSLTILLNKRGNTVFLVAQPDKHHEMDFEDVLETSILINVTT